MTHLKERLRQYIREYTLRMLDSQKRFDPVEAACIYGDGYKQGYEDAINEVKEALDGK